MISTVSNRIAWAAVLFCVAQTPPDYATSRAAAIKACEAIPAGQAQSGLMLNPDGYRSYYVRSQCLQEAAVQFRDLALCARVTRRWSLLSSSWGYSAGNCRTLVGKAMDADRQEVADMRRQYLASRMVLRDFAVERNGNGRDYDVMPAFDGTAGHGYTIAIELLPPQGSPVLIFRNGYFVDQGALRLFIRQQEIKAQFPAFEPGRTYQVRMTAIYSLPGNGGTRFLSDAFLEQVFPLRERTQAVVKASRF